MEASCLRAFRMTDLKSGCIVVGASRTSSDIEDMQGGSDSGSFLELDDCRVSFNDDRSLSSLTFGAALIAGGGG
eukprot:2789241-Amphidinium_carterae.1